MLYVREDIPPKLLSHNFHSAESFLLKATFKKKNALLAVAMTPTRVILVNILILSVDH